MKPADTLVADIGVGNGVEIDRPGDGSALRAHDRVLETLPPAVSAKPRVKTAEPRFIPRRATVADDGMLHEASRTRDRTYRRMLAVADVAAALIALILSFNVVGDTYMPPVALFGLPLVILVAKLSGLYDRDELVVRKTTIQELPELFNQATLYALLCWLAAGPLLVGPVGSKQALMLWFSLFALMVLLRRLARLVASRLVASERLLLIGDAGTYNRLADKLSVAEVNAELVGRMSLQRTTRGRSEDRTIDEQSLRSLIDSLQVHRVLIVPSQSSPAVTLDLVRTAKAMGIRVSLVPQVMDVVGHAVVFDDILGMMLLGVRPFSLSRSSRFVKRATDVVGATLLLTLLSPLLVIIAIAIKLDSRGSVLFRQQRVGRDDEVFSIFKFRSMVADAEERKQELLATGVNGGLFKINGDPRATRVGRFLRRTSLDELPQLINVLRGQMSLVGPRPLIASEDRAITGYDRHRLKLTPGMTGPWQLMGSRVPLTEMVKVDYLYVTGWSLMEDIGILLRTAGHIVRRRGM